MVNYVLVLALGLAAGSLSEIIGTGASIMLLPVLVFQFGPKQAVPIMAIAALMSNVAKVTAWWREVDWRAFAAYSMTGIPAAALGARTLLVLPSPVVDLQQERDAAPETRIVEKHVVGSHQMTGRDG